MKRLALLPLSTFNPFNLFNQRTPMKRLALLPPSSPSPPRRRGPLENGEKSDLTILYHFW